MKLLLAILIVYPLLTQSQTSQVCKENLHYKQKQFYDKNPNLLPTNSYKIKDVLDKIKTSAIQQKSLIPNDTAADTRLNIFLENLSSDTTENNKYEDPYILWFLTYLRSYLDKTLTKFPDYKLKNICIGTLPSTEPNAYTESVGDNSYLLIFNRNLFLYIDELLKLGLTGIEKEKTDKGISFKLDSFDEAKKRIQNNFFLVSRYRELMNAFVKLDELPQQNFLLSDDYKLFQYALLIGTERFIMSHEIAHALLNHKESNTVMDLWGRELSADVLGYKIYLDATLKSKDTIDIVLRNILLSVPLFYFEIVDIFTDANLIYKKSSDSLTTNEKDILIKHIRRGGDGEIIIKGSSQDFTGISTKLKYPDGVTRSLILLSLYPQFMEQPDISVIAARNIQILWDTIKTTF